MSKKLLHQWVELRNTFGRAQERTILPSHALHRWRVSREFLQHFERVAGDL